MTRFIRCLCLFALMFAATACNQDKLIARFTPHPESEVAKQAIDDWRSGRFDALRKVLAPAIRDEATDDKLRSTIAELPKGEPRSVKLVAALTRIGGGEHRYDLRYEYEFDGRWLIAQAVVVVRGKETMVTGLHGEVLSRSLEQTNAFTFANKGGLHLLMLFLAVASPVFCLIVCVICIRTPIPRRKVLWALFTLIGAVTVHFNWTTGHADFVPFSFQLLGASVVSQPYGPWIIGVSLPIGAIVFLARRKVLMAKALAARRAAASGNRPDAAASTSAADA